MERLFAPTSGHHRSQAQSSVYRNLTYALGLAVLRLGAGLLINELVLRRSPSGTYAPGGHGGNAATSLLRWDSGWYLGVAFHWYPAKRATVFFPGYPMAVRLVEAMTLHHLPLDAAGLSISWVAFVVSVPLMLAAIGSMCPQRTTRLALILYTWSPASVFLIVGYPEGSFIALSAGAVLSIQRRRFLLAAILAGIATAFSPLGICLAVAVAVAAFPCRRLWQVAVYGLISIAGLVAWMSWQLARYGNPLLFLTQQKTFNRHAVIPFSVLISIITHIEANGPPGITNANYHLTRDINAIFVVIGLAICIYYVVDRVNPKLRRFPLFFGVYSVLSVLLPASSTQTFYGIANPEAVTRLTTDGSMALYPAMSTLLLRSRYVLVPVLFCWVGLAVVVEVMFVRGWYFT